MRVKNESRWLPTTFESLKEISTEIIVLDDGSTDKTLEICKKCPYVVKIIHQEKLPFDETRDKNKLLDASLKRNPDFILTIDGDESFVPGSEKIIFSEIELNPNVNVFEFQELFVWDKPNQYRCDGVFGYTWQKRLLRIKNQSTSLHFEGTTFPGNMHCPGLPQNSIGLDTSVRSNAKILHYGYYDEDLRVHKYKRYTKMDPNNTDFDNYSHILSGTSKFSGKHGIELKLLSDGECWSNLDNQNNSSIERIIPNTPGQKFLYQEHLIRYLFATQFVKSKTVLDAACGSGYGSSLMLEKGASQVIGIDNSSEAIDFCKKNFPEKNLEFHVAECTQLPFNNTQFDLVVSFETIEHLQNQENFVSEISRVLNNDGILVISTPNSSIYEEKNPYHEHELNLSEFNSLLRKFFTRVIILKQFYPSAMCIGDFDYSSTIQSKLIKNKNTIDDFDALYFYVLILIFLKFQIK